MATHVATVLTVYGIETQLQQRYYLFLLLKLQQYLPFTVLKLLSSPSQMRGNQLLLQQYLPFTVLKHQRRYR